MKRSFDPEEFYSSYPEKVILRPGYPARAQYKSTFFWNMYGKTLMKRLGDKCNNYADIGGCFGFGANAMSYHIFRNQGEYPATKVFEVSNDFIFIGKLLFPNIEFVNQDFSYYIQDSIMFDLVTLFDVIEHIPEPKIFLESIARHTKYALIKTPLETSGDWFGAIPPINQGTLHEDGHVNFFNPDSYRVLLKSAGFDIIMEKVVKSIFPLGKKSIILQPEYSYNNKNILQKGFYNIHRFTPDSISRKIFGGGDHICLVKSHNSK